MAETEWRLVPKPPTLNGKPSGHSHSWRLSFHVYRARFREGGWSTHTWIPTARRLDLLCRPGAQVGWRLPARGAVEEFEAQQFRKAK